MLPQKKSVNPIAFIKRFHGVNDIFYAKVVLDVHMTKLSAPNGSQTLT